MNKILDFRTPQRKPRSPLLPADRHVRRILMLAFAFFISGFAFFALRMGASRDAMTTTIPIRQETQPVEDAPHSRLANLPSPSSYRSFQYHADMGTYSLTSTCEDRFAVVMLFPSGSDYREDPQSALYNAAAPCSKGNAVETPIPLEKLHLVEGNRYYVVRAQQGSSTWYNPY
jgi:hypothetical protein